MRIAWFTPFALESAIGRFGRLVTDELSLDSEVDIWHPAAERTRPTKLRTEVISRDIPLPVEKLLAYDAIAYNIGNYLPFHRDIFEASQRVPGIVILHDFVLHHFFSSYFFEDRKAPPEYLANMRRCYGPEGERRSIASIEGNSPWIWETDEINEYPLFEPALWSAHGVVVHSPFFLEHVKKVFDGPVRMLPLAYDAPAPELTVPRSELALPEDALLIITVGNVNPNKRIESALKALTSLQAASIPFVYVVIGSATETYRSALLKVAERNGIGDRIRFTGPVSDETLRNYLHHADICVTLRYPATEGASASAIEQMLAGAALIVTDTGFYADLPDECVIKIGIADEAAALPSALLELASGAARRKAMGRAAKEYAAATFSASAYASGFLEFAGECATRTPVLRMLERAAIDMAKMGLTGKDPLVADFARRASHLFLGGDESDKESQRL